MKCDIFPISLGYYPFVVERVPHSQSHTNMEEQIRRRMREEMKEEIN